MTARRDIRFQLARMARVDSGGSMDRLYAPGPPLLAYKDAAVEGGALLFSGGPQEASGEREGLFDAFLDLKGAPPSEFRDFAQRYGPLWVCPHGSDTGKCVDCGAGLPLSDDHREALSLWGAAVDDVLLVLEVAAGLHRSEPDEDLVIASDAWKARRPVAYRDVDILALGDLFDLRVPETPRFVLSGWGWPELRALPSQPEGPERVQLTRLEAQAYVEGVVNWWLRAGNAVLGFSWRENGPQAHLPEWTLRGAIAKDLMLTVCRVDGLAFCDNCSRPFIPSRKPRKDQHTWCPREVCQSARYRRSKRKQRGNG